MQNIQFVLLQKEGQTKQVSEYTWNKWKKDKDGKTDGWAFLKFVFLDRQGKRKEGRLADQPKQGAPAGQSKSPYIPVEVQALIKEKESGSEAPAATPAPVANMAKQPITAEPIEELIEGNSKNADATGDAGSNIVDPGAGKTGEKVISPASSHSAASIMDDDKAGGDPLNVNQPGKAAIPAGGKSKGTSKSKNNNG